MLRVRTPPVGESDGDAEEKGLGDLVGMRRETRRRVRVYFIQGVLVLFLSSTET